MRVRISCHFINHAIMCSWEGRGSHTMLSKRSKQPIVADHTHSGAGFCSKLLLRQAYAKASWWCYLHFALSSNHNFIRSGNFIFRTLADDRRKMQNNSRDQNMPSKWRYEGASASLPVPVFDFRFSFFALRLSFIFFFERYGIRDNKPIGWRMTISQQTLKHFDVVQRQVR